MDHSARRPYTIELYLLLPSVVALLSIGIVRIPDIEGWPQIFLILILAGAIIASTKSVALLLVAAFVLLDKAIIGHPVVSYLGAIVIGLHLLITAEPKRQPSLLRGSLLVLGFGLAPVLFPWSVTLLLLLLLCLTTVSVLVLLGSRQRELRFFSNPLAYLAMELPDNRHRFQLACLSFLAVGSPTWGHLCQEVPYEIAALVHGAITLLSVPFLLNLLKLDAVSAEEFAALHSKRDELLAEIVVQEKALTELRTSSDSLQLQAEKNMARLREDLRRQEEVETKRLKRRSIEAQLELDAELTRQKRAAAIELEAAFYGQPFDSLVAQLCNKDMVSIPGGPTISTKDHLLIGTRRLPNGSSHQIDPVFMHKKILQEHVHILGGTGTGKTAQGITPLAVQLLRQEKPAPMIFLDLKGDSALFHTAREEAERNNQDFLFFSIESNKSTYRFNPFVGIKNYGGTKNEQIQPLLDALGLNHGDGYGRSFFTRVHRQRMFEALKQNPDIYSFSQLIEALSAQPGTKSPRRPVPVSSQKDELVAAIEGLSDYPQLFTTPEEEATGNGIIQFDKVFARNQVVYFWLPAPTQSISVREIGKLILYNLFFAALKRRNNDEVKQAYLFIDEFQRLVGENLALFLEQSRSYGISLILANQNIDQLNTPDAKLWPLVQSNVRASLHFGSGDPKEIELLSKASGEVVDTLFSTAHGNSRGSSQGTNRSTMEGETHTETEGIATSESSGYSHTSSTDGKSSETTSTQTGRTFSESESRARSRSRSYGESDSSSESFSFENTETEYIRPQLRPEDIASVFNKGGRFFLWVRRGVPPLVDFDGKPIAVEGLFTMPEHQYRRRASARWPEMAGTPNHVIQSPTRYKTSGTVTEKAMVSEFLSALKEPY